MMPIISAVFSAASDEIRSRTLFLPGAVDRGVAGTGGKGGGGGRGSSVEVVEVLEEPTDEGLDLELVAL